MPKKTPTGSDPEAKTKKAASRGSANGPAARSTSAGTKKPNGPTAEKAAPRRAATAKAGAATSTAGAKTSKAPGGKAGASKRAPDLRKDLRDFAGTRPQGWSHDEWLTFLDDLRSRGHNINDRDAIGSMLERERLVLALERIPGVGPQRVRSIADRYGYLWRLKETSADQLARESDVPKGVAEKVIEALKA